MNLIPRSIIIGICTFLILLALGVSPKTWQWWVAMIAFNAAFTV